MVKTIITVGYVIAGILLFSLFNFYLSVRPPKFSTQFSPSDIGLPYENVSFTTKDGLTLKGWFVPGKKKNATIIVGHGYPFEKSNVVPHASFLHDEFNLFFFDFRYFGESEGAYTTVGLKEQEDLLAALSYLKSRKDIDAKRIGGMGFSMSAATMIMTETEELKAIVAESSFADLDAMVRQSYRIFPGPLKLPFVWATNFWARLFFGIHPKGVSPAKSIANKKIPILLIHGDRDSQIPVENSKIIYENSNKKTTELWTVEGVDHGGVHATHPKEYEGRVREFFEKHLLYKTFK